MINVFLSMTLHHCYKQYFELSVIFSEMYLQVFFSDFITLKIDKLQNSRLRGALSVRSEAPCNDRCCSALCEAYNSRSPLSADTTNTSTALWDTSSDTKC